MYYLPTIDPGFIDPVLRIVVAALMHVDANFLVYIYLYVLYDSIGMIRKFTETTTIVKQP